MNTQTSETMDIEFQYDSKYQRQVVEEQYIGGWINVDVVVGNTQIYGQPGHVSTGIAPMIVHHSRYYADEGTGRHRVADLRNQGF